MRAVIAVLPGDGIGPEVTAEALRVLEAVAQRWDHHFETPHGLIGGAAIDATGDPLPAETVALCRSADAILLGAVGGPRWDDPRATVRPEQGLLGIRGALGLYANLRPVRVHPALAARSPLREELLRDVDFLVVRELTGGIYFGAKRCDPAEGGERAVDECVYTTAEIERIVRVAATLARARRGRLTSVDKANVLETSRLWRRVATRVVTEEFPEVRLDHLLVDACAMHLLRRPADFDVVVTENMFGDILTDEASMLAGSMGVLPSASLAVPDGGRAAAGRTRGLYEPVHGSAPDIAGAGVANPLGAILSVAMMLRHSLALPVEAEAVERAVTWAVVDGSVTRDLLSSGGREHSTRQVGEAVAERLGLLSAVAAAPAAAVRS